MSKVCDLCNAPTEVDWSRVYSSSEYRSLVVKGLQPSYSELSMFTMMGMSHDQALSYWKSNIVNISTTDWLLCPSCAAKANSYKFSGEARPRPVVSPQHTSQKESPKQAIQNENEKPTKDGCFIATSCYGSYNAAEVLILRQFRDETMLKFRLGRCLVDFYYLISPPLSQWLSKHAGISSMIRKLFLNKVVKRIQQKKTIN